jgi:hypothetical protein
LISAFGQPKYGEKLSGDLVFASQGCSYGSYDRVDPGKSLVLVKRGGCAFVQKAEMAEAAGAVGLIVSDNQESLSLARMNGDANVDVEREQVNIPAVSILKADGEWIAKQLLGRKKATGVISWPFEAQRTVVKWELWAQAYSEAFLDSDKFHNALYRRPMFTSFKQIAAALAPAVIFEPRFFIVPGNLNKCDSLWNKDPKKDHCGRQCGNRGLYCTNDPDGDPHEGMDSVDMLEENLRQICIYKWAAKNNKHER